MIDTFDVTFSGYGGAPVKGWLHFPAHREPEAALPVIVHYVGYSGGTCPPFTVFASFNAYGSGTAGSSGNGPAKDIEVYRFNNHEGGQEHQWIRQLLFLRKILG